MVCSLIGIYDIPEPGGLGRAGGQGSEAPAQPASLSLGLDWIVTTHEPNAVIGLVTSATPSILGGGSLARDSEAAALHVGKYVVLQTARTDTPSYIPITDSNTGHV